MELPTFLSCLQLPAARPSLMIYHPSCPRNRISTRKIVMKARKDDHIDHGGKLVDANMIVLRMRIKEMKMMESGHDELPSNWMEWEKKYYATNYNEDILDAMALLQSCLMNTRPSLALGMLAIVGLSVPISTFLVLVNAIDFVKVLVSGFHLIV